jgi:hypothetical protein
MANMRRNNAPSEPVALPPTPPTPAVFSDTSPRVVANLGEKVLHELGPIVRAQWNVPAALARALAAAGRPVPKPVEGFMLIDTGATTTCIALDAAEELGLHQVAVSVTYGAGGQHQNKVFHAELRLGIRDGNQDIWVVSEQQTSGIPQLDQHFKAKDVRIGGQPARLIGLLGRDFLRHTRLVYDGQKGFELFLLTHTMNRIDGLPPPVEVPSTTTETTPIIAPGSTPINDTPPQSQQ